MLAFILALATLVPAACAWQEEMRALTQARMTIAGALAIATLPSVNHQLQNTSLLDIPVDKSKWTPGECQAAGVQMFFIFTFIASLVSLFASFVSLTLPLPDEDASTVYYLAYWSVRAVATFSVIIAVMTIVVAIAFAVAMNYYGGNWAAIGILCFLALLFLYIIIVWLKYAKPSANGPELPR